MAPPAGAFSTARDAKELSLPAAADQLDQPLHTRLAAAVPSPRELAGGLGGAGRTRRLRLEEEQKDDRERRNAEEAGGGGEEAGRRRERRG